MKKIYLFFITIITLLCLCVPVFASEPIEAKFTIKNIESKDIQIQVTAEDGTGETYSIPANASKEVSFTYTEPDLYRYSVKRVDVNDVTEPSYTIQVFVESDDEGKLMATIVPVKNGDDEKPLEITFGKLPPQPAPPVPPVKTGDTMNVWLYVAIAGGAMAVIAGIVIALIAVRKKRNQ